MPLDKTGPCPFAGDHWPLQWGGQKITPKTFSSLHSGQKKDLIEYYYKHEYTTAPFKSLKPYPFPNIRLKEYLGIFPENLKRTVLKTPECAEYVALVAERQRSQAPPPPPEMPAAPIAACQASEPPAGILDSMPPESHVDADQESGL